MKFLELKTLIIGMLLIINCDKMKVETFRSEIVGVYIKNNQNPKNLANIYMEYIDILREGNEENKYRAGLEIAALIESIKAKNSQLAQKLNKIIASQKNRDFIFLEHYEVKENLIFNFWKYGQTIPHLEILINYQYLKPDLTVTDRVKYLSDRAIKYNEVFYGRLEGESTSTTYSDECIHNIYFDKEIPLENKYSAFSNLSSKITGSALGNAFLSMALIDKKLKSRKNMKINALKCINTIQAEQKKYYNPYNDRKREICEEMLE